MGFVETNLAPVAIPRVVPVEQYFDDQEVGDMYAHIRDQLINIPGYQNVKPGMRIAVTAGSRGLHRYAEIIKIICDLLKDKGAAPFIVPAMGSHGGATAEGQKKLLEQMHGITEESMGVPILSSMEVVNIGHITDGRPVNVDKYAHEADGIVLVNRIKPHTSFQGKYESGLMKMMTIGLGKQHGAQYYHKTGFKPMPGIVAEVGEYVLKHEKILFGAGLIDNGYGHVHRVACMDAGDILEEEAKCLLEAKKNLAQFFWKDCDVCVLCEMGKDIAGCGMDPNVTGRFNTHYFSNDVHIEKLGVLDITEKSHGNATGIGLADATTKRLFDKIDIESTYTNCVTNTIFNNAFIPLVLGTDKLVFKALISGDHLLDEEKIRLCLAKNTHDLGKIYITENMVEEAVAKGCKVVGEPQEIPFDDEGNLLVGELFD
jgi:hypothetical protein